MCHANSPIRTRIDAGLVLAGELGVGYLKFYELTGKSCYR